LDLDPGERFWTWVGKGFDPDLGKPYGPTLGKGFGPSWGKLLDLYNPFALCRRELKVLPERIDEHLFWGLL
jgi:hypothetical protein